MKECLAVVQMFLDKGIIMIIIILLMDVRREGQGGFATLEN